MGNPFGGEIDEFRIWNVARSANDINVFKNASLTGSESGLQAYYDFNHATAIAGGTNTGLSTLEDRTANNIDGTLTNFTLTGSTSNWLGNPGIINNTSSSASSTPTLCINSALTNITHTTTGATGIGTATGLPTGVGAAWASNTITISGTPTVSGAFNYTIPLTGGCGTVNATAASRLILKYRWYTIVYAYFVHQYCLNSHHKDYNSSNWHRHFYRTSIWCNCGMGQ
ncbi:MAG: hypothetical protein IPN89_18590 [Saprospiraceae bacterium]|nr:hypothetical protein [Saprospiraceae bacterium]